MTTSIIGEYATDQRTLDRTILDVLPAQGNWSEASYLWLTNQASQLIEFSDGAVEVLPMPTQKHQAIVLYLYRLLFTLLEAAGGKVYTAPLRLRIGPRRYREPDLLALLAANDPRRGDEFWSGADLVIEVVSPDSPGRDLVQKRAEYAAAGIAEYWIVNPLNATITVLRLEDNQYDEHGVFASGNVAVSALLSSFSVSVDATFNAD